MSSAPFDPSILRFFFSEVMSFGLYFALLNYRATSIFEWSVEWYHGINIRCHNINIGNNVKPSRIEVEEMKPKVKSGHFYVSLYI